MSSVPPSVSADAPKHSSAAAEAVDSNEEYPHDVHPGLVPGVSVEDQKVRYGIDKPILLVVGALVVAFVIWGVVAPMQVFEVSTAALQWVMANLGWVFNTVAIAMVVYLLYLAFSRFGKIPLGLDGEKPEYSTISWAAMLFGAGIGIGIIFFGAFEPLTYYLSPRPNSYDPASMEAVTGAMAQAALHWGLNAWAIYAIVGLAVAYVSYRRGRVPLMSSVLVPLFGGDSKTPIARLVDGLAIIATLFGTAASLGIGALQIAQGFTLVTGWSDNANRVALAIIVVLTIGTIISAVSGVAKGIKRLSDINLALAGLLAVFVFVVGPTAFLLNVIPGVISKYFQDMFEMLSANMAQGEDMTAFLSSWTTFYWAWWVSWAPFVGVFVAKISKGRTIRQFVIGVLTIPSTIIVLAFTVMGGTAIWLQRQASEIDSSGNTVGVTNPDLALAPDGTVGSLPPAPEIFFHMLDRLPWGQFLAPVIMIMLAVFFITTADSASLVNSQLSQRGNPNPNRVVTAFWAVCMSGIAVVILLAGGQNALQGLQNLITITALPFAIVIVLMCVGLYKELRSDPMAIRDSYEGWALEKAVRRGISEHGDDFMLAVEPATDEYATGADFDSYAEENTAWYARTDEDGNPVDYDYETGTYTSGSHRVDDPDAEADTDDSGAGDSDADADESRPAGDDSGADAEGTDADQVSGEDSKDRASEKDSTA